MDHNIRYNSFYSDPKDLNWKERRPDAIEGIQKNIPMHIDTEIHPKTMMMLIMLMIK